MISYYGHSSHELAETKRRLDRVRAQTAAEAWSALMMEESQLLGAPFDLEIAQGFGIDAVCRFRLCLVDKQRAHLYAPELVERLYRAFEPGRLVMTWELDSILPPPPSLRST